MFNEESAVNKGLIKEPRQQQRSNSNSNNNNNHNHTKNT
jgi:hypothetical protein